MKSPFLISHWQRFAFNRNQVKKAYQVAFPKPRCSSFLQNHTQCITTLRVLTMLTSRISFSKTIVVPITNQFTYLGTIITSDRTDRKDVEARFKKANSAFGALKRMVFGQNYVCNNVKGKVYVSIVLQIHLYGSKCCCPCCVVFTINVFVQYVESIDFMHRSRI